MDSTSLAVISDIPNPMVDPCVNKVNTVLFTSAFLIMRMVSENEC